MKCWQTAVCQINATQRCNLPSGPAQICSWYPQGPEGSITLLETAKPLFLSPQDFLTEGISTFNERLLQVFPICCYSLAVTMGRQAFRRRYPLVSDCSTQSDCGGAGGTPPGFSVWGTYWGRKMALASPGEEEWCSKRDTGQLFPPLTCYPTQGKKLAQRREGFQCVAQPAALQMSAREALCANA